MCSKWSSSSRRREVILMGKTNVIWVHQNEICGKKNAKCSKCSKVNVAQLPCIALFSKKPITNTPFWCLYLLLWPKCGTSNVHFDGFFFRLLGTVCNPSLFFSLLIELRGEGKSEDDPTIYSFKKSSDEKLEILELSNLVHAGKPTACSLEEVLETNSKGCPR